MNNLIDLLHLGCYSCVIENHEIRTFSEKGVKDLLHLLNTSPDFLKGAAIADKVVGKAAASIMISGGVKEVYSGLISAPAVALLENAGIPVSFKTEVPVILNQDKSDWCPLEKLCREEHSPGRMVSLVQDFIKQKMNTCQKS